MPALGPVTTTSGGHGGGTLVPVFASNILFAAGLFAHAFLYNFYLDAAGHGPGVMGDAAAALTAGGLTALVPAAFLVDRAGPRAGYLVAATLAAVGLALGAIVTGRTAVLAAAFLAGTGTATWRVSMAPLLIGLTTGPLRARAMSWNVGLLVASGAAWTALSGGGPAWLAGAFGMGESAAIRVVLLVGAVGTLLAAAAILAVPRVSFAPVTGSPETRERRGIPLTLVIAVVLVALWMTGSGLVLPFFNIFFERAHDLSVGRIGLVLASSQALTAVALLGGAEVAARFGPRRALVVWMLIFPPALWLLAIADAFPLALGLFLVQGIVPAATNPLIDQVLLERAPAGREGAVSSARNAATETSGLVGASIGGRLIEIGSFGTLFATAGAVALTGAVGLLAWLRGEARRALEDSNTSTMK